jgi:hypothetical protein
MSGRFIRKAAATLILVSSVTTVTMTPAAAWYYNQPYNRPCRCHPYDYEIHRHRVSASHPLSYYGPARVTYAHHPWRSRALLYGPVVDCI